nr:gas vesicle protein GvpD [Candidatus Sigynarchaeota archaeon]
SLLKIFDLVDKAQYDMPTALPDFIGKILNLNFGYVLLIKGAPGTGKTTLSMEMCSFMRGRQGDATIVFVSTRSTLEEMREQYATFVQRIDDGKLADLSNLNPKEKPSDPRMLDINNRYPVGILWALEKLLKEEQEKRGSESKQALLILDSVEKIIDALMLENPALTKVNAYEAIISYARSCKLKMVLVSEEPGSSEQDYLVDGIIKLNLNTSMIPDKFVRYMDIMKLRHIEFQHPRVVFSRYKGRFTALQPANPRLSLLNLDQRFKDIHDMLEKNLQTQGFFANLMLAKHLCLEVEPHGNDLTYFAHIVFINVGLMNKLGVFYMSPVDLDVQRLIKGLERSYDKATLQHRFRLGGIPPSTVQDRMPGYTLISRSDDINEEIRDVRPVIEDMRKHSNGCIFILPIDAIFIRYDKKTLLTLYFTLISEKIVSDNDVLLVTSLASNETDPAYARFFETFSSRILFFMKTARMASMQLMYWVKLPRLAYAINGHYDPDAKVPKIDRVDILPIA